MAKKGGTKRKITIEKITKQESLRATFSKRKYGLFSKASQLCLLSGSQIAILTTPPSSDSNVSFHSFGHSSVETLADAYLTGQRPPVPLPETKETREDIGVCMSRNDLGLGFWWDDEKLKRSENPQELMEAMESMSTLLKSLKNLNIQHKEDTKNKSQLAIHGTQEDDQTLNDLHKTETYLPANLNNHKDHDDDDDMDDLPANITEEQALSFSVCQGFGNKDNNNNNNNALVMSEDGCNINQEMDNNQFIDFNTTCEGPIAEGTHELHETTRSQLINSGPVADDDVSMKMMISSSTTLVSDSDQCVKDGDLVLTQNRALDEDNLRFSDFFNCEFL
ncbi:unnamed protein product [Cochlearia groenlandica]